MLMNKIAIYIKQQRKAAGLTQEEFAELLDVTTRTVQYWEAGKSSIKAKHESIIRKWLLVFKLIFLFMFMRLLKNSLDFMFTLCFM